MLPLTRLMNASGSLLARFAGHGLLCRGCLEPLAGAAEAGLCGRCWEGLLPLPENRCPVCALPHDTEGGCPEPTAWSFGDALWDYHGGRPPLGSLLLPSIKGGERGWKQALLRRVHQAELPDFAREVDILTAAPTTFHRRWLRGFDLAEEAARLVAERLDLRFRRTLGRNWIRPPQTGRTETERRRLPRKAIRVRSEAQVSGRCVLLMDDVWTTGTTLLRCAQALQAAGAQEVRVLTLFRAL